MKTNPNSLKNLVRRPEGKCKKGLHDWIKPNIIVGNDGRPRCRACRERWKNMHGETMRKRPVEEVEVEMVPAEKIPFDNSSLPKGFWDRVISRVKLLDRHEALKISFSERSKFSPTHQTIHHAARRGGTKVGTLWRFGALYVWREQDKEMRRAA